MESDFDYSKKEILNYMNDTINLLKGTKAFTPKKKKMPLNLDGKLHMEKYRNDWKYAQENKLIPKIPLPNWMKPRT